MLKIRLARGGAKKRPYYHIVVSDVRSPRDGKFLEKLGSYNPMLPKDSADRIKLNEERIRYWLGTGAQPTERVEVFLRQAKIVDTKPDFAGSKRATKNPGKYRKEQPKEEVAEAPAAEEAAA